MLSEQVIQSKDQIKSELKNPYAKVPNALEESFAKGLREELLEGAYWSRQDQSTMPEKGVTGTHNSFKYSRDAVGLENKDISAKLLELYEYLNSKEVLEWMTHVSGRRCDFFEGSATIFKPGDHISRHNDLYTRKTQNGEIHSRALTFNYWLTDQWVAENGGRFIWEKPYAEIVPDFNTLVLFLPTEISQHWVEPVAENVEKPRLAISGWFMTDRTPNKSKFTLNFG